LGKETAIIVGGRFGIYGVSLLPRQLNSKQIAQPRIAVWHISTLYSSIVMLSMGQKKYSSDKKKVFVAYSAS
jgi:hypothetical protein